MKNISCVYKAIVVGIVAVFFITASQSSSKANGKIIFTSEQAEALKRLNEEIVISLIKRAAIVSIARGEKMPDVISGPINDLTFEKKGTYLAIPTINSIWSKQSKQSEKSEKSVVEFTITFGEGEITHIDGIWVGTTGTVEEDDGTCTDHVVGASCTGGCPC